jgi:hypothetical protein
MNTQQQAYIEGFVKRAAEYGLSQNEAIELLKSSGVVDQDAVVQPGQKSYTAPAGPVRTDMKPAPPVGVPAVSLQALDSRNKGKK